MANEERKSARELPLPPGTFGYVLDTTKGIVKLYTGPVVINQTGQDRPVRFNPKTFSFDECSLEQALQQNIVVPEGFYAVLTNPAKDRQQPNKMVFPSEGQSQPSPDLAIGLKENIPGPVHFALFPGQTCEVRRGHHLRSNEYLRIKIYNEDKAKENWAKAVIKSVDAGATTPTIATPSATETPSITEKPPSDLTVGKQYNVLGTKVAFYIPPTGVSVVPEATNENGKSIFVRQAETLEQLEYSILVDENGMKSYPRGPAVVFPEPTQQFFIARDSKNEVITDDEGLPLRKFRAVEINELQGIHLKFVSDGEIVYADGSKDPYKAGDQKFITGAKMPIYYPEEGHQLVRYDGKTIHYAVNVTDGEGKYVLDRLTGNVELVKGPTMLLPNPIEKTIAYRALSDRESRVWFPGSDGRGSPEALAWNQKLRHEASNAPTTRQGVVSDGQLSKTERGGFAVMDSMALNLSNSLGDASYVASAPVSNASISPPSRRVTAKSSQMAESRQGKEQQAVVGDVSERRSTYNEPRALIMASKFRGVPTIKVTPGYSVSVVSADGSRRPVIGPKTVLLQFAETLDVLRLSTGKPKNTDAIFETAYLNIYNNKVTDILDVETSDHVGVSLKLIYNVNFEGDSAKWFTIENYVKHLCDHVRSLLKGALRRITIENFYRDPTGTIRDLILGTKEASAIEKTAGNKRPGLAFDENGMRITDVDVMAVTIADAAIATLLARSQHEAVRANIDLSLKEKALEVTKRVEEIQRQTLDANHVTYLKQKEIEAARIDQQQKIAQAEHAAHVKAKDNEKQIVDMQGLLDDLAFEANLEHRKATAEADAAILSEQQTRDLAAQAARVDAIVRQMAAIQPGLIEALNSTSAKETLVKIAGELSFHQMFGAESGVDFIRKVFANSPLQAVIESTLAKASLSSSSGNGAKTTTSATSQA